MIGSVGLFVVISIAMYATRNIDWYRLGKEQHNDK
ncbi:MAG: inner membrane CreD family protein [Gammaproteobacteria bacterium]|uniref:Inner membrane CreD family protein n=1 Tax=Candidatus Thiopontia autotrophica TaxID=2841688 RepID=A0A8J6TXY1_9GAMM|nr:inner membrane CreD family protein [Candidatus Thiopontia autotrophica]